MQDAMIISWGKIEEMRRCEVFIVQIRSRIVMEKFSNLSSFERSLYSLRNLQVFIPKKLSETLFWPRHPNNPSLVKTLWNFVFWPPSILQRFCTNPLRFANGLQLHFKGKVSKLHLSQKSTNQLRYQFPLFPTMNDLFSFFLQSWECEDVWNMRKFISMERTSSLM